MQTSYRKTKPLRHYAILGLIYGVGLVTLLSHTALHAMTHHEEETVVVPSCKVDSTKHQLIFTDNGVVPEQLHVRLCDRIVVLNNTMNDVELAIGSHAHHTHYPGFEETVIKSGSTDTFSATKDGTFIVHDHDDPSLSGILVVQK